MNSASENNLFRSAVTDVTPLQYNKITYNTPKPSVIPLKRQEDDDQVLIDMLSDEYEPIDSQADDILSYCQAGIQRRVFSKLRRGHYPISDEIDLHGLNIAQAKIAFLRFIQGATPIKSSCVRIIHGKGKKSLNKGSVIKRKVSHWLQQHDRVLAYHSTQANAGGTGAVYVLLRRRQY